jgi:hypothetical protein
MATIQQRLDMLELMEIEDLNLVDIGPDEDEPLEELTPEREQELMDELLIIAISTNIRQDTFIRITPTLFNCLL